MTIVLKIMEHRANTRSYESNYRSMLLDPLASAYHFRDTLQSVSRYSPPAGLKISFHADGTNVEGDWDEVFQAVKQCHHAVHEMGAPRITTTIKVGTRVDRHQARANC